VAVSDNRIRAFKLLPPGRLIYAAVENSQNFTNLWDLPVDAGTGKPGSDSRAASTAPVPVRSTIGSAYSNSDAVRGATGISTGFHVF
jgi:hypothetical protein